MKKLLGTWLAAGLLVGGLSPTPSAAQGAPETQPIVYARSVGEIDSPKTTEIFIMDGDGTNEIRLTDNSKEDAFPALSPDGTRIAFSRKTRGQYDLFVMDADGTDVRKLMGAPNSDEVLPTWSPKGNKIAFTATTDIPNDGWQSDIYRMRVSDGRFRRLTYTPRTKEFAPDWSPDGTLIAFTKQNEKHHRYGIGTVAPNAEEYAWLVINPLSGSGYTDVNPSWSPDSEWVAFSRDHGEDPFVDIFKVSRDGTQTEAVTDLSSLAQNPVWGADDRILFMHDEGLAVVPSDGGDVVHITPTRTGLPYWWPDW